MQTRNQPVDISFIVVSWNAKEYLYKCLASIEKEAAGYRSEVIVVDNASSDGSQAMVRERFPQVKLIDSKENLGFAKANNIGIRQSRGKYLALINSDVEVLPGCIGMMTGYMEEHRKTGILGPQILDAHKNVQRSCMGFPTLWNSFCRALALDAVFPKSRFIGSFEMTYWPHDSTREVDIINGCFWLVRRTALQQVGVLDERFFIYGEDMDWCKRFWDDGWKVEYFYQAKAVHYGGASSSNAPVRFFIEMNRANLKYWRKHHSRPAQMGYLVIIMLHYLIRYLGAALQYATRPAGRADATFKIKRSVALLRWLLGFDNAKEAHYDKA
ncbi:MAG: glycosyltransferase family 2 protein [Actinomycetota bacterium]|nr:glycosyltransferase family 2 protein [Nitrospiraceae bacterium]MDA8155553.1 glycosyltransferase family 2 protein [Actinomycetota bacterium]